MKTEVLSAANLVVSFANGLNEVEKQKLKRTLIETLCRRYQKHWYPNDPSKGSAYRCLGVGPSLAMNPVMASVMESCGLANFHIDKIFPEKILIMVNPNTEPYAVWVNKEDEEEEEEEEEEKDYYDEDDDDDVYDEYDDDEYEEGYGFCNMYEPANMFYNTRF